MCVCVGVLGEAGGRWGRLGEAERGWGKLGKLKEAERTCGRLEEAGTLFRISISVLQRTVLQFYRESDTS